MSEEMLNLIYIDEMQAMIEQEILSGIAAVRENAKEISRITKILETTKDEKKKVQWEYELREAQNWRLPLIVAPMMFWGPPGSAKTQGIRGAVTHTIQEHLVRAGLLFTYLSAYDQIAVRGMPVVNRETKMTEWYPQDAFPSEEMASQYDIVIWVLDELSAAPKAIQPSIYRLLQEGQIEGYVVPKNVMMIAAGNDKDDRAVAVDMSSAMANRMAHFDVRPSLDPWKTWAIRSGIDPMVIAFHNSNEGEYLHNLNTESVGMIKGFPTLRTWEKVSQDLEKYGKMSERMRELRVVGHVGFEAGTAFNTFYRIHDKLPDVEKILDGESNEVPEEDHIKFATLSNLVAKLLKNPETDRIENFFNYINLATEDRKEMGYMAVNDFFRASDRSVRKNLRMTKAWTKWADVIINMEAW